jgi:hypothetical protein
LTKERIQTTIRIANKACISFGIEHARVHPLAQI